MSLAAAPSTPLPSGVRLERDVPAPMRDGVVLRADVYRPQEPGSYPVLLMRVPYNKVVGQSFAYQHPSWYAQHGYVVVIQDVRGRYASQGEFDPLRHEAEDGYDTVEWAATLPESNGRVGMYGFSYAGATQLLAASEQPPSLVCCAPAFTAADYYDGWMYEGGALNLGFVMAWTIQMLAAADAVRAGDPAATAAVMERVQDFPALFRERPRSQLKVLKDTGVAPYFFDWLAHDTRDEYWQQIGLPERYDAITVPCLHIGGWFDVFSTGTVRNFEELSRRAQGDPGREQRLMMGPWIHMPWAPEATGAGLGESFAARVDDAVLAWSDRWLKAEPQDEAIPEVAPVVEHFVMSRNQWEQADRWPPTSQTRRLYLASGGRANSRSGDGSLVDEPAQHSTPDAYVYDPGNPVVSAGGRSCCNAAVAPMGQACQASVEVRNDVLLYTGQPLEEVLQVSGSPSVTLYAATSAVDVDFVVRLVDVGPGGRAVNVSQGILRASFRESLAERRPMVPYEVTRLQVDLHPTSWLFRRGHRIRLQVTSSDFPATDPNLNTGADQAAAGHGQSAVATQWVRHDRGHPSALELPLGCGP